jgi:hypothetical protein
MFKSSVFARGLALSLLSMSGSAFAQSNAQVQKVVLLPSTKDVEIEIRASHRIVPQSQVVAGPDRLVLDFAGAVPGAQLRTLTVNRGGVKAVRSGLFRSNPPITRIVLDLNGPLPYQVFPSGSSVIVKLGVQSTTEAVTAPVTNEPPPPPPPVVNVSFQNGTMSVTAERTNLAAVLTEIRKQTNAEIAIPAGAEQEPVIAKLGPGPVRDVVAALLNGSNYNFIIVGTDSSLVRLLLSPKGSGAPYAPPPAPAAYNPTPPQRIAPPPQPAQPAETMPQEQEVPEQSGDQANDNPQTNEPANQPGNEPGPQPGPPPQN